MYQIKPNVTQLLIGRGEGGIIQLRYGFLSADQPQLTKSKLDRSQMKEVRKKFEFERSQNTFTSGL